MAQTFKRRDCRRQRNLAIFWAVKRDARSQDEVAAEYGISQQRVSAIVRAAAKFVALAPSEEFEGIPQLGQLQYAYRILLAKLDVRRRNVALAFEQSMGQVTSVKNFDTGKQVSGEGAKGSFTQWKKESAGKTQHGDWRLDRQLGEIDREIVDATIQMYGRDWLGWNQLEKAGMVRKGGGGKAERGKKADPMRNSELGMRNGEPVAVADEPVMAELVVDAAEEMTKDQIPMTKTEEPAVVESAEFELAEAVELVAELPVVVAKPAAAPPAVGKVAASSAIGADWPAVPRIAGYLEQMELDLKMNSEQERLRQYTWVTGPNPCEVLSRDVDAMTYEQYREYRKDIKTLTLLGAYRRDWEIAVPKKHPEWRKLEGL